MNVAWIITSDNGDHQCNGTVDRPSFLSIQVMPSLKMHEGETLLKELLTRWNNHKIMIRWLSRFFNYLDRWNCRNSYKWIAAGGGPALHARHIDFQVKL
jgi:hypothetical protein